jgi:hypothetical protein
VPKQTFVTIFVIALIALGAVSTTAQVNKPESHDVSLTQSQASHFARLALRCVAREYPNKPEHVLNDAGDVKNPKALHPLFTAVTTGTLPSTVIGCWCVCSECFPTSRKRETFVKQSAPT